MTAGWSRREVAVVAAATLAVAVLLLATASTGPALVNDPRAAALSSWTLGTRGELALPEPWPASANYWGVETPDGRVHVNRFPGVAYWAAPVYAVTHVVTGRPAAPSHPFLVDLAPAAWSAALTVTAAGVVAYLLLRRLVPRVWAGAAALTLVLGTGLWSVAADALWPHGPAALALLALLLAWRRTAADGGPGDGTVARGGIVHLGGPGAVGRDGTVADSGSVHLGRRVGSVVLAGVASAVAVLVRPHLVVPCVVLAGYVLWREPVVRRIAAAVLGGAGAGLVLLAGYSRAVFGVWTPTSGYDVGTHLDGLVEHAPWQTVRAFGLAFVDVDRGVFVYAPVLAVALLVTVGVGLAHTYARARGRPHAHDAHPRGPLHTDAPPPAPAWTVAAAVAGLAYLVVQVRAVGYRGGDDFFGARISLETVVLSAPLLTAGVHAAATRWARTWQRRAVAGVLASAAVASVGVHAFGAVARSVTPETVTKWEDIDRTVRRDFGSLELGEVDLRRDAPDPPDVPDA